MQKDEIDFLVYAMLFYHPTLQRTTPAVKVYSDFHHRKAAECETFRIVFQIDLVQCGFSGFVQLQLHNVEGGLGAEHHIHTPHWGTDFHINVIAEKTEYNVKHLLEMAFGTSVVTVRYRREERLQQAQGAVPCRRGSRNGPSSPQWCWRSMYLW